MSLLEDKLIKFARVGDLSGVKSSIDGGADIHAEDDWALQLASDYGHLDVVKFLVENGADIHADNDLALRWASPSGHMDIVAYLILKGADHTKINLINPVSFIWNQYEFTTTRGGI